MSLRLHSRFSQNDSTSPAPGKIPPMPTIASAVSCPVPREYETVRASRSAFEQARDHAAR